MKLPQTVTLSSNTLFHFTNSIDNLLSILTHEFRPSFCKEKLPIKDDTLEGGIPMVCFCDIPLSQTRSHMSVYGSYGLGLTKSWGIRQGISPVLYSTPSSPVMEGLYRLIKRGLGLRSAFVRAGSVDNELWGDVYRLSCFVKPYKGEFVKRGDKYPSKRFYDEREWRWVPDLVGDSMQFGIDPSECDDSAARQQANEKLQAKCRLSFTPRDIRYIIVAREREILPVMEQIDTIKGHYSVSDRKLLSSRLISAQQIAADF
jgi:hypothetical protein